jgi:hypothetical protein
MKNIILHGNSCIFEGLVCGEIHFENSSCEANIKYNKIKIRSNLKETGTRTIFFVTCELNLYIKFR